MAGSYEAFADSPELRESYERCEQEMQGRSYLWWAATTWAPAAFQPPLWAVSAVLAEADRIVDEGPPADRERSFARWRAETMAEIRSGRSEHPLRRAFVDTMRRWDLDVAVLEECFETLHADAAGPLAFAEFEDLRRYLRGASGTTFELIAPLIEARDSEAMRLLSVLAEALALVDIFEDLPEDLAQGRCYLPRADLRRLGLEIAHLGSGEDSEALDELVRLQVGRGRELLAQAALVTQMVGAEFRMGVQALVVGGRLRFDEIEILRSRVLAEGLDPMLPAGAARIRPLPLNAGPAPGHVAVIMDGNRRWAEQRGLPALEGHRSGELALGHVIYSALRLGIRHLSVYAFSTENWNRSLEELAPLFDTMAGFLTESVERLQRLGVQVRWCGQRDRFDPSIASALALLESMTSNNSALMLTICADYGGREELAGAARALAAEVVAGTIRPEDIGPADLARHLYVPELPDVDLLIRTSGEQRISNFLPWQLAYAELVFDPVLWPDFGLSQLYNAVAVYAGRQRRFGADLPGRARPAKLARTG